MPIYDYECRSCGHREEVLHGVNAPGPTACDRCGGPLRKLLSPPAIVFKGSGWAKKDARQSKPAQKSTAASDGAESGSKGAESTAAEPGTKTEASSEKKPGGSAAPATGKRSSATASD